MIVHIDEVTVIGKKITGKCMRLQDGDIVMTKDKAYKVYDVQYPTKMRFEAHYEEV